MWIYFTAQNVLPTGQGCLKINVKFYSKIKPNKHVNKTKTKTWKFISIHYLLIFGKLINIWSHRISSLKFYVCILHLNCEGEEVKKGLQY